MVGSADISYSFGKLKRLADTFAPDADRCSTVSERRAIKIAKELGPTAIPLLGRKLRAADDGEASWAYFLLCRVGGERAIATARALALDEGASDGKKALALALLMELGAELPDEVTLADPQGVAEGSVRDLVESLTGPAEVARAADLLLEQIAPTELAAFLGQMLDVAGAAALPLHDEFLLRDDVDPVVREALIAQRTSRAGADGQEKPPAPGSDDVDRPIVTVQLTRHEDGRVAVFACTRASSEWPDVRAFVLRLGAAGAIESGRYLLDVPPGRGKKLREELTAQGYKTVRCPRAEIAALVARAARRTRAERTPLPREYWLGRDLLGLRDEHLAPNLPDADTQTEIDDLLVAAEGELDRKRFAEGRALAERYVAARPDDAEGRTCFGACLLELGQEGAAVAQFAAAARLEPDNPLRHWNLSHAAKRASKLGACYLALVDYLRLGDADDDEAAAERTRSAKSYLKLFDKYARLEHPDAQPLAVARAEELFARAYQHMLDGRHDDAVTGFEAVLKLVPSHYPSWGNLGAAYVSLKRRKEAEFCLKKALEFRPDYEIARQNLAALRD